VTLAMREVRAVNPDAELIQTEDLGRVFSTPKLAYQAKFENERRWLSFDLLSGRVDRDHALYDWIVKAGVHARELELFVDEPCTPDILGINHYITSNRYLDEQRALYPKCSYGSNGRHRYADVESVRVQSTPFVEPAEVLREAWDRYGLPIAITEAHLGCTRDEQMRWLLEIWKSAMAVRNEGVDLRAVTCWSLLGAFDWNSLVTQDRGHYEPGAFDVRGAEPRQTALCNVIRALASKTEPQHPVLDTPGW
jgi:dTDP-4-dehydrorhamnose reductase